MILVINSGSSSLKFKLFSPALGELAGGLIEKIGLGDSFFEYKIRGEKKRVDYPEGVADHKHGLKEVFAALGAGGYDPKKIRAVGHRVVHGGEEFTEPTVITPAVLKRLRKYNRLAPLHNPANLSGIDSCLALMPWAKNVAVFDTAFYRTIPDRAFMYALPWEYYAKHKIRKYGFHGISHRYVTEQAALILKRPYSKLRLISCHLGSGSSVTAVKFGKAIETTMGFTPLEGLTMSTRCGDIDPAIPLYLIRTFKLTEQEVDDILNKKSGILGISGFKDLRDVLVTAGYKVPGYVFKGRITAEQERRSRLALEMFCYDVARYIASFAGIMGGVDAVIFTAGVGERSQIVRDMVLAMVDIPWKHKILVVPTNEELMIAKETRSRLKR